MRQVHQRKLKDLGLSIGDAPDDSIVVNLSDVELSSTEINLLKLNIKHAHFPNRFNELEVEAQFGGLFTQAARHILILKNQESCYSLNHH